ncbi:lipid kinase YegS [Labrenzia sp. PHM005]|uniref:lipid kinase YegS n=1 Tax=Labrenzia sp. PHM005 TaxID=2590016 RepID=UPI0011404CA5|nr:lipid kinase YegS [Labrenzia sp. PHM005]QDG74847.1 lipid kinase YegS [Labrenzia sp. PHM005]
MNKRHLRLILNGKSAGRVDVRSAVEAVRAMGHEVSVRVTYEAGDTERFAAEALREHQEAKIDVLVSAGGDGTIHEVVDGVLGQLPGNEVPPFAFAVLPLGTANDFARHIRLDPADIMSCLRFAARATPKPTDIGTVNGRVFVNMATGGFGTKVTSQTDPKLKKMFGGAAYLFTGLHRFSELAASAGRIEAEGFQWEGAFLALAIGNGRRAGGGIRLCPKAKLDDGLLDLTILPMPDRGKVSELLAVLFEGDPARLQDIAIMRRVRSVTIETRDEIQMNLDGEPLHETRLAIETHPARINLIR